MSGRNYAVWDLRGPTAGKTEFDMRIAGGERVVSYSMYGQLNYPGPDDIRHAFVWKRIIPNLHGTPPVDQRMSEEPLTLLEFMEELQDQRASGYSAAYVGVFGPAGLPRFSAVYERTPPGSRPEVILGAAWDAFDKASFTSRLKSAHENNGFYARSVGVFGTPSPQDFGGPGWPGLSFVATLWPKPARGFGWSIQRTLNQYNHGPTDFLLDSQEWPPGPWRKRWETRAMAVQAYPVAGVCTSHLPGYGSFTVTLWHDVRYAPWPKGDPFGEWEVFNVLDVEEAQLAASLSVESNDFDRRPLSIGAAMDGGKVTYFVPMGRKGTEEPLPRTFLKRRIGQPGGSMPRRDVTRRRGYELDEWMKAAMQRTGARHAQLVVVRRGELVHASAYTWAEAGYPIATLDHSMRLASVSKILTGFLTWASLIPQLPQGLDAPIGDSNLLGLTSEVAVPDAINSVTLRLLLSHNTGFSIPAFGTRDLLNQVIGPPEPGPAAEAVRREYGFVEPGMLSKFLQLHTEGDYFDATPGDHCHFVYVNSNFTLLGECISNFYQEDSSKFGLTLSERLLSPCGVSSPMVPLYARGWEGAKARSESPGQDPLPATAWNTFERQNTMFPITSAIYARNGIYEGAAGGWSSPLLWVARILGRLSDVPGAQQPYLGRAGVEAMSTLADPSCPGSVMAFGCYRQTKRMSSPEAPVRYRFNRRLGLPSDTPIMADPEVVRIHHNGMTNGGSALLMHQFALDPAHPLTLAGDTLSFCIALNLGGTYFGPTDGDAIFDILQKMEWEGATRTFPDHDLFDDI